MSDCCTPSPSINDTTKGLGCPTNQQIGKTVNSITLKALLNLPLTEIRPVEYRFCRAPDCPTVYYSTDGSQIISETDLREKVYQKHPNDADILVCYCFQHTIGSTREEISRSGHSTAVEQINNAIKADLCACDIRNPQGTCCLGNVRELVQRLETEQHNSSNY